MTDATERLSRADVLSFLGDERRLTILTSLYDETLEPGMEPHTATYTELQTRTEIEDSGRFNYHLSRLTGHFIEKRDRQYHLREPGKEIVRLLRRGGITEEVEFGPEPSEATCFRCESPIEVSYTGSMVLTQCTGCRGYVRMDSVPEGLISGTLFPSAGAKQRDPTDLMVRSHDRFEQWVGMMGDGFCPECGGETTGELDAIDRPDDVTAAEEVTVSDDCRLVNGRELVLTCTNCGRRRLTEPLQAFVDAPAIAAELRDCGAETAWDRFGELQDWEHEVVGDGRIRFTSSSGSTTALLDGRRLVDASREE